MGKVACFMGLHNWKRSSEVYYGNAVMGENGKVFRVPAQTYIEKCTNCPAERGIIDAGYHKEEFSASYVRGQMRAYDQQKELAEGINYGRHEGPKINLAEKQKFIKKTKDEWKKKIEEEAVAKYKAEHGIVDDFTTEEACCGGCNSCGPCCGCLEECEDCEDDEE